MEQRIKHSEHVGSILTSTLRTIQAKKTAESKRTASKLSAPQHFVKRDPNKMPLRVAMARRKLIARGSGVYEDSKNGDIWFREGEYLVRQAVDIDSIVTTYLDSCQGV